MIELTDEQWRPQVTVIGIGESGVRVLLKSSRKRREELKLCAIVSDERQLEGREKPFTAAYVSDACLMEQYSDLYQLVQNGVMFLIVTDTSDIFR